MCDFEYASICYCSITLIMDFDGINMRVTLVCNTDYYLWLLVQTDLANIQKKKEEEKVRIGV